MNDTERLKEERRKRKEERRKEINLTMLRYTREEMLEKIVTTLETFLKGESHGMVAKFVVDAWMCGSSWKGWNNASDYEIAEEFLRITETDGEIE
jgi:hypothetical protein